MSTPHTTFVNFPDQSLTVHHDDTTEASPATVRSISRRSSILSVWSSDSVQTETFDAGEAPRLRRQGTMLSMSTHYTESSFGSHTELSDMLITRTASGAGMRRKHEKADAGFSIARERRKRLQEERLSRAVRPRGKATEPVLEETTAELRNTVTAAGAEALPVTGREGKVLLDETELKPQPWTKAHQRSASAEATAQMIRHAREVLNASHAELLRLENSQKDTVLGDGPVPQRRNTTGLLSRGLGARSQSKRATADGYAQVTGAARNFGSIPKPSDRVQELMARFDREIKARVEADIEQRRRLIREESSGKLHMLDKLKDSNAGANKPAKQEQRAGMTEKHRAVPSSGTTVANDEEPTANVEVRLERVSAAKSKGSYGQVNDLNRKTSVEEEPSARLDLSLMKSYDERFVVSQQAIAATMVPVRKARLVKVIPRPLSVNRARNDDGSPQGSPRSQPSPMCLPRRRNYTPTKQHSADEQSDSSSSPRQVLNKKEMRLAQILQPEDFIVPADISEKTPEETVRKDSGSVSPFERPSGALSSHLGNRDEEDLYHDQAEAEDDKTSLFSFERATDDEPIAWPAVPLFNMPNSPFLYHREEDDDCPSLTTDDDQDRRTESIGLGGQEQAPPPPSPPFRWEHKPSASATHVEQTGRVISRGAPAIGDSTHAIVPRKYALANVEVHGDGPSAVDDSLLQREDCDGCEENWIHGKERMGRPSSGAAFQP